MRYLVFFFIIFLSVSVSVKSQTLTDTTKTIFENDKFTVTEYFSTPGKDICGLGWHSHKPHLNILLTDAEVELTKKDEEPHRFTLKAGATIWSEAETHMAINNGIKPIKLYIVEPKN